MSAYRMAEIPVDVDAEETPESVIFDTLRRLNRLDDDDAQRVVRGLAAFLGFSVGRWERSEEPGYVDEESKDV